MRDSVVCSGNVYLVRKHKNYSDIKVNKVNLVSLGSNREKGDRSFMWFQLVIYIYREHSYHENDRLRYKECF